MFGRLGAGPAATIFGAFADPEPIVYTLKGGDPLFRTWTMPAVRCNEPAPMFEGPGSTLRRITYEVQTTALPERPSNGETFTHRSRRWRVTQVEDLDEVAAWLLTVVDAGAAA